MPCPRNRQHKNAHQNQIQREEPARGMQILRAFIFHHHGVKLTRQTDNRQHGQQGVDQQGRDIGRLVRGGGNTAEIDLLMLHRQPDDKHPHHEKRHQLNDRFKGDRHHHAAVMLGVVDMTGAKQHGEYRQCPHHKPRNARILITKTA